MFLWSLLGCDPCPPWTNTGDTGAWEEYVAEVEAEFAVTGECPTEPPERAVTTWGCGYDADPSVSRDSETRQIQSFMNFDGEVLAGLLLGFTVDPDTTRCVDEVSSMEGEGVPLDYAWDFTSLGGGPWFSSSRSRLGFSWTCLESLSGPRGTAEEDRDLPWVGSMFGHGDGTQGLGVSDTFIVVEKADCVWNGENAGAHVDKWGDSLEENCDGVDNDLDGVVDEGAADADHNDVADCHE